MKKLILILGLIASVAYAADVKISQLPLGNPATVGANDSFPYVDATTGVTKRLTLFGIGSLPGIGGISPTIFTTTGDLLYASAPSTPNRLGVGTQYQVLQAGATTPSYGALHLDQSAAVTGVLPNANTTAASANTASAIVTRDSSGNFIAGTITAALTGNASTATTATNATNTAITDDTSTNATMYPTWVTTTTGNLPQKVSSTKMTFNPSTATLTTTTFSGALSGNATTATSATSATNATNIAITDDTSTNATMYPTWVTANTGNLPAKTTSTKLTYNPSTGSLATTTFVGALTGTASGNTTYSANNHGVVLSGSANTMTVVSPNASTAFPLVSGGSSADPTWALLGTGGGGTGVSSVTTAPSATAFAGWDANKNMSATAFIPAYTTTATAAGTTTLTNASNYYSGWTGTSNQTVVLPVATTMANGQGFYITNASTGTVTVTTSGTNTIQAMGTNTTLKVWVVNTAGGTGTASWNWTYGLLSNTSKVMTNPMTTGGDIIYGANDGSGTPTRLAHGSAGMWLQSNAASSPLWSFIAQTDLPATSVQSGTATQMNIVYGVATSACTSGACTLARNVGLTNVTHTATGIYTVNFAATYAAVGPCFAFCQDNVNDMFSVPYTSPTTTAYVFQCVNQGSTNVDAFFQVACFGSK